ncbi:kinase-like domain-containing protein [Rhizophagus irregularis DAOM 181602=DAOM 197198]|nr:kinase-like domain-containing protein [Rhizophagus irregularis DAOM 181602=DAOM 197198]
MALINANEENSNSFDPTPKLKTSPIPILFITCIGCNQNCFNCNDKYTHTLIGHQRYCKKCLTRYINDTNDSYLDATIRMNSECDQHRNKELFTQNIQEWCVNCSRISLFKQICFGHYHTVYNDSQNTLQVCPDCYQISFGWIESIPILYLPWWDANTSCIACGLRLVYKSPCQKYCVQCYIIYIGCRYCLTTNIIFGFTDQSQCKKCKRILSNTVDISNIYTSSGNDDLDHFLYGLRSNFYNNLQLAELTDHVKKIGNPLDIYELVREKYKNIQPEPMMEWIPYSQIKNLKEITSGGFSIIYRATWENGPINDLGNSRNKNETVAVKRFKKFVISKHFINEVKSNYYCYRYKHHLIRSYGFTKVPDSEDYILESIHKSNFIHRDIHSGNILLDLNSSELRYQWKIADLGLSHPENILLNNEIYGVIPYIAPEIFKTTATFSKKSDVYSMGMIMWELTTGCKPFDNIGHDYALVYQIIDGIRPAITEDTPECFANLMNSCWSSDPQERPTMKKIRKILGSWYFRNKNIEQFNKAEIKRRELINSKKLGPHFTVERHSEAIYTSRSLQEYITKAYEFDINNTPSSSSPSLNFTIQNPSTTHNQNAINTNRLIISRKRKIEESNVEIHDNGRKCIKINKSQ